MKRRWLRKIQLIVTCIFGLGLAYQPIAGLAQTEDAQSKTQVEINEGLEAKGILRVGMEANYAPFNWSQPSDLNGAVAVSNSPGEYANGYDVQVARRIADQLGLELEIVKLEWDGLPPALTSGKVDAIIAGMSATPERKKEIDFTENYYDSQMVLVVRKDSSYATAKSLADFKGAKVTGQLNTFHYDLIPQIPQVQQQTAMDSFPTMISSVLSGKSDAYVSEEPGAMAAVAANSKLTYVKFADQQGFDLTDYDTGIAIGIRKGSPLTQPFNQILAEFANEDRDKLMKDMVQLNLRQEDPSFWDEVVSLWNSYGNQFLKGAANTMLIALVSTIVGSLIGLVVAVIRSMRSQFKKGRPAYYLYRVIDFLLVAYIEIFRGTPMMVQAMLIFYGLKLFFNIDLSSMTAAFLIVSINTGAYLSEVIRGGIHGVDKGQYEGAKAIGMTHTQTMRYVVLPQAIQSILPTLGNEFVINIKDTSVLNVIAVTELFFVTRSAAGSTYLTFQAFFITSIIYFVLTFVTTRVLNLIEKSLSGTDSYTVKQSSSTTAVRGVKTND
ncbi:ABC transporter substrate-binding protein/permease [Ignavigranum ruoffiae]|uniref:ABC transporter substrate-binding protein/permease n=1 Tax=Ignavigranum ruoffiae TaxID=89093 RepID=UPI00204CE6CA|nr:ABC transporter substrate-binding protein/permease [Ignavigranum ruoffiae]UPQ85903.1 ABC transporter substrate-binding protein/permease [Ignavigranum ruoffiae]